jgi:hypothetical protein
VVFTVEPHRRNGLVSTRTDADHLVLVVGELERHIPEEMDRDLAWRLAHQLNGAISALKVQGASIP